MVNFHLVALFSAALVAQAEVAHNGQVMKPIKGELEISARALSNGKRASMQRSKNFLQVVTATVAWVVKVYLVFIDWPTWVEVLINITLGALFPVLIKKLM